MSSCLAWLQSIKAFLRSFGRVLGLQMALLAFVSVGLQVARASTNVKASVDFNRDIRPILGENCLRCHGPDEGARKAGVRLDVRDGALKPGKSGAVPIVAGDPAKSELLARVSSSDPDHRMPPRSTGKTLTV